MEHTRRAALGLIQDQDLTQALDHTQDHIRDHIRDRIQDHIQDHIQDLIQGHIRDPILITIILLEDHIIMNRILQGTTTILQGLLIHTGIPPQQLTHLIKAVLGLSKCNKGMRVRNGEK